MSCFEYLSRSKRDLALRIDETRNALKLMGLEQGGYYGSTAKVDFVDQLQGPNLGRIGDFYGNIIDEAAAKRFGARNIKEYSYWSWRACAIANVAMVLSSKEKYQGTLFELIQESLKMNGYVFKNRWGAVDVGWRYRAMVSLLGKRGLSATIKDSLSIQGLVLSVMDNSLAMVSVKSSTGGHMVLVKGFVWKDQNPVIIFNDPFVFNGHGGENQELTQDEFDNYYLGRAIIVS
jgi:hypothetical protein